MAMSTYNASTLGFIIILLALVFMQNNQVDAGTNHAHSEMIQGTIKTIETEDGETVDCVDIYKQPALSHPLLKDHKIKLDPGFPLRKTNSHKEVIASWAKNGGCPNGTVPFKRNPSYEHALRSLAKLRRTRYNSSASNNDDGVHEYAVVGERHYHPDIRGAKAKFNVWNPRVPSRRLEFSLAQLWLEAGRPGSTSLNVIEAGWMVPPMIYGHSRTVFFTYWTNDGYESGARCYNLACEGFVRTNEDFAPGDAIPNYSVPNGDQVEIDINIYKGTDGNWWLEYDGNRLGYWPKALFTTLADGAQKVTWGGEIVDSKTGKQHTTTQMGSGAFPSAGFGVASYVSNLKLKNQNNNWVDPTHLAPLVSKPNCYDLKITFPPPRDHPKGYHFLYGGPGFSPRCTN